VTLLFPRPGEEALDGGTVGFSRPWRNWFGDLWNEFGFNFKDPIYNGRFFSFSELDNDVGAGFVLINGRLGALGLDNASTEGLGFSMRLPNDYVKGTDLKPYIVWAPSNAGTGTVLWYIDYSILTEGTAVPAATTIQTTANASGTTHQVEREEMTDITGTSFTRGDILLGTISRVGGSDTYGADALLLGVGFEYQVQGKGSRQAHP